MDGKKRSGGGEPPSDLSGADFQRFCVILLQGASIYDVRSAVGGGMRGVPKKQMKGTKSADL